MTLMICLAISTGLGALALFPGFHFAMLLMIAGPWLLAQFGVTNGLLGLAWSVVIARNMHCLAVVYHPVAADSIASADPAQKLAARGLGDVATQIMNRNLTYAVVLVGALLGLSSALASLAGMDPIKAALRMLNWLVWPAALIWLILTLRRAKNRWGTLLVLGASGFLGAIALLHPAVKGHSDAMTPLLTGLFGIPVLLMTLFEPGGKPAKLARTVILPPKPALTQAGLLMGLFSVVLPGLGSSSLVSMGESLAETDDEYLHMASLAESIGEVLALCLGILGLAQRSSDAAVIQKLVSETHLFGLGPGFPYWLMALMILAALVGAQLVWVIGPGYRWIVTRIPQKLQALVIGTGMAWVVFTHTGTWGLAIMLVGTLIHLGARQLGTPNQAFFSCLLVPMILGMLAINPWG